jgi:outer membrane protein TolC
VQPFFTPQGLFLLGPAKDSAQAASLGADDAREQILLSVARSYLAIEGLDGLIKAGQDAEKIALRREADAKVQIAAGTAIEIALLRAQNETANSRAVIANFEGQRQGLLAVLESLVGEPITTRDVTEAQRQAEQQLGAPAPEEQQPWEQTYSVQSAIYQVKAAQGLVRYDEFQWLPSVNGVARGNYNSNTGFQGTNTSYDLILNVTIPLYDRGQRYVAKKEDTAKLQAAQASLASIRARAHSNWQAARANLLAAQAVLAQSEASAVVAKRAQEQLDVSAKAGVATSLDLSDADQRRFQADSAVAQARAAVDVRLAEIAAAEGRLYKAVETGSR